ncbi:MAG TPA: YbhN family protein [Solirubrobacteraceae bacterium]|nr:YbhN family protein [Solirubrobacteraceae bacterium]
MSEPPTEPLTETAREAESAPAEEVGRNTAKATRNLRNGLISVVLLLALVVGLLLAVPGLHGVGHAITHMGTGWLIVAVLLEVGSCLGYVLAFLQVFDRAPLRLGARIALAEQAFGAAVAIGGAGSAAVGSWLLVERGAPVVRVVERSAVLFLLTSAINVITAVLASLGLLIGVLPGTHRTYLAIVTAVVGTGVFVFFLMLPRFADRLAQRRESGKVRTFLTETAVSVRDTERLLRSPDWRIIGAIAFLWCDIGVLIACFAATGHVPSLSTIVLAYQLGYLVNIIPIPGSIGVLDGSLVGLLVLMGVNATRATAATLVYHAIALWVPASWGTVAFLILRRSRGEPIRLRPTRAERRKARAEPSLDDRVGAGR